MSRSTIWLLAVGLVLTATAVVANPFPAGQDVPHAIPGGGAIDAPVPAVGELGGPSRPLSAPEMEIWLRGRALFDHDFHRDEGLGAPEMNADSCRGCHQDPAIGGAGGLELNVSRFGYDNGGTEAFQDLTGGQGLSRLRPPFHAGREEDTPGAMGEPAADVFEQRQTPALFGAGLIDSIPDAEILSNERMVPDADGVLGVARMIDVGGTPEVGRFGWKAQIPRLADFLKDAMFGECGITTPDPDTRGFGVRTDGDAVSDPELSTGQLDDMLFFLMNLAPPPAGQVTDATRDQGEALFTSVGCASCHTPELQGAGGPVPLFSNLLLHDVAPDDFRGMAEDGAGVGVYQTPPLWGNCHSAPYMHDGAAETMQAAILLHFGEADTSRQNYEGLTQQEQDALLLFLSDI